MRHHLLPPRPRTRTSLGGRLALLVMLVLPLLGACPSTTVQLSGRPVDVAPLCGQAAPTGPATTSSTPSTTLILWAPAWRADQKDVPAREQAAEQGLIDYLQHSACFAHYELRRAEPASLTDAALIRAQTHLIAPRVDRTVAITVHELGPVLRLLSSAALVEGGTQVVLGIRIVDHTRPAPAVSYRVHWQNGGAGIVKGVATLPADMRAALQAAFE